MIVIGTPKLYTILKLLNIDWEVYISTSNYITLPYFGLDTKISNDYLEPIYIDGNKAVYDFKSQEIIPVYKYYYKTQCDTNKIISYGEINKIIYSGKETLIELPLEYFFDVKVSGVYVYYNIKNTKRKNSIYIHDNFDVFFFDQIYQGKKHTMAIEPWKNTVKKVFHPYKYLNVNVPDNIIVLNEINNNNFLLNKIKELADV